MREIKFRVWDGTEPKMWEDLSLEFLIQFEKTLNKSLTRLDNVLPKTVVMQYTGLKDKNGKEIYEGDIVIGREVGYSCEDCNDCEDHLSCKRIVTSVIKYGITNNFEGKGIGFYFSEYAQFGYRFNTLEVIGNIYENPELLK